MDLLDLAIFALRIVLVALLYVFLWLVLRFAAGSIRPELGPRHELRLEGVDAASMSLRPGEVTEVADVAIGGGVGGGCDAGGGGGRRRRLDACRGRWSSARVAAGARGPESAERQ